MYNCPIKLIETPVQTFIEEKEDKILATIQQDFRVECDREELIRALKYDRCQYEKGYADGKADAMDSIVRCKDCKHRKEWLNHGQFYCGHESCGMAAGVDLRDGDFCSYGERRTDNG